MKAAKQLLNMLVYPRARLGKMPSLSPEEPNSDVLETPSGRRGRRRFSKAFFNFPLIFGALVVIGLFLVVLFGPVWATSFSLLVILFHRSLIAPLKDMILPVIINLDHY